MTKRGRPLKASERRDMIICVRFTLSEYRYLKALSMSQKNRPVSEVVRSLALVGMPLPDK